MFLEFILGAIVFLLIFDYSYKKHCNDILKKYKIPGPKALPVIGSALELRGLNTEKLVDRFRENKRKYGKIYHTWILHQLSVFILDIKHLEVILASQETITKNRFYNLLQRWLGTGLLLSNGKKWHTRRKLLTPTFHFKILEQFVDVFDQQSAIFVKKLHEKADGKTPIDIFPFVCLCALDIIAETAMGVKIHAQDNPNLEYVNALATMASIMATRVLRASQRTDWLFFLTAPKEYRRMCKANAIMHKFTNNVIEERRGELEKSIADGSIKSNDEDQIDECDIGKKNRMAFLDMLLQSTVNGSPLSNADIREEVDTFMFEGHDTTASAISYALYLISRHPEVQEKLRAEIQDVLGRDESTAVSYKSLQELKYLECVIKETLRLYPSVPVIGRELEKDTVIGDIVLPAKSNLSIQLFMVMRDPEIFPDPEKFQPERFFSDTASKMNPFAFAPFSAGPRNCIGQKFAMLEMKSTISKVLRYFELLPLGPDPRPMINLILRSANGVHVGLKPRERLFDLTGKVNEN